MSFESDVNEDVKANLEGHVRWYVERYLPNPNIAKYDKNIAKEQAGIRGRKIDDEQSLWFRDSHDSARLKVIEYLDSHPSAKQHAIDYIGALHRVEMQASYAPPGADNDGPAILREELHRLEGGFLASVVQGIYNENHPNDLAEALDEGGLAVNIAGMAEAAAEAKAGGIESANRFEEAQINREEFVHQAGKEEVKRTIGETGGKSTAENWPNTAQELGNQKIQELESNLGRGTTDDLINNLNPGRVPGDSAWQEGNIRHPERFTPGAEKQEGASDSQLGHTGDGKVANSSSGPSSPGQVPQRPANAAPSSNVPASQQSNPDQIFHPTAGVHTQVKSVSGADGHRQYVYGEGGFSGQTAREHAANPHEGAAWQNRNGADIICPPNTPVYAAFDGVVGANFGILPGHEGDGPDSKYHGNRLSIEGSGNSAYYAHLDHFARGIAPGKHVHAGQLLGYSGVGGDIAHLHIAFERGDTDRMLHDAAGQNDRSRSRPEQSHPTPSRAFGDRER